TSRLRPACFRAARSHFRQQRDGILDAVGDEGEELTRLGAVAGTVVEDEAQVHDLADGELTVDDPRTLLDPSQAEHGDLGQVDDRRGSVDAEDSVVVQRERASRQFYRIEPAGAG